MPQVAVPQVVASLEVDRPVLGVLVRVEPEDLDVVVPRELDRLRAVAAVAGLVATGDALGVFHAPVTEASSGPLEVVLPVDGLPRADADPTGGVRGYRLTGGLVASRRAEGADAGFPRVLEVYDEVRAWITGRGGVPVGPPRETWHAVPGDAGAPALTVSWPYAVPPQPRPGAL